MMMFTDRREAGERLVTELLRYQVIKSTSQREGLVLGIPRGGVVTAQAVDKGLGWKLSVVVTKKVGAPMQEELAIGAMGPDGEVVWNERVLHSLDLTEEEKERQVVVAEEKVRAYREKFLEFEVAVIHKVVIIVDDGMATGATMLAAVRWAKKQKAKRVIAAVPVCAVDTASEVEKEADQFACLERSEYLGSVGQFYRNFEQVSDEEVVKLLKN
ncbi:MAG: phosphoribosyltransferase [Candidatus Chisholmbacteria bacterium]|nr:phosphoribosyltransferase [Candidatus Chisholmbacteria bacterium]